MGKKKKKKGEQDNEKISVKCVSGNKLLTLLQVGQSKSHKFTSVPSLTVNWNLLPPSMIYGYLCRACENDPVFVAMMIFKCFAGMRRRRRPTHTVYILYMYTHTHSHKSAASCAMKSDTLAPLSAVNPPTPRKRRATEADRHLISQRSATVCRERNGGSLSQFWQADVTRDEWQVKSQNVRARVCRDGGKSRQRRWFWKTGRCCDRAKYALSSQEQRLRRGAFKMHEMHRVGRILECWKPSTGSCPFFFFCFRSAMSRQFLNDWMTSWSWICPSRHLPCFVFI